MRNPALLLLLSLTAACHVGARPPATPPAPAASPCPSAPAMPDSIHWLRNSAEYRAAVLQAYRQAAEAIDRSAAGRARGTWAVVLDADETIVDNSAYNKERAAQGLGFSPESWRAWTALKAARAMPGAVGFLEKVRAMGGTIAIVTNRTEAECPDTEENFRQERIPYDLVLCKPDRGDFRKDRRFEQVAKGTAKPGLPPLEVLLFVGDNIQDFPGLTQDLRGQPDAAFDAFGPRFIVLPNPIYGSWERSERK